MAFLDRFPKRWFNVNGQQELLTNVCRRVTIPQSVKDRSSLYIPYTIRDGDRPDILSRKLYGTPDYWWIILMVNDVFDFYQDWPIDDHDVLDIALKENADVYAVRHYEDEEGNVVDPRAEGYSINATPEEVVNIRGYEAITYIENAERANNIKRNIKLVDPDFIKTFDDYLEVALYEQV